MQLFFGMIVASIVWGLIVAAMVRFNNDLEVENRRLRNEHRRLVNDDSRLLDLLMQRAREEIDRELGK